MWTLDTMEQELDRLKLKAETSQLDVADIIELGTIKGELKSYKERIQGINPDIAASYEGRSWTGD